MEIKKKNTTILDVINKATIYKFLKDLTNHKQDEQHDSSFSP